MTTDDAMKAVEEAARAARGTVADLASVPDERLDAALREIADALGRQAAPVLAANEADMAAGREAGLGSGLLDRLRLDEARLGAIAGQLRALADVPFESTERVIRELPGRLTLTERRRPVGVAAGHRAERDHPTAAAVVDRHDHRLVPAEHETPDVVHVTRLATNESYTLHVNARRGKVSPTVAKQANSVELNRWPRSICRCLRQLKAKTSSALGRASSCEKANPANAT